MYAPDASASLKPNQLNLQKNAPTDQMQSSFNLKTLKSEIGNGSLGDQSAMSLSPKVEENYYIYKL